MIKILSLIILLFTFACNKPKAVYICGDHVCINKAEAELFFKENLTLEVRIIDKKKPEKSDLVELNLNTDSLGNKKIKVFTKDKTKKEIKVLSKNEIKKKKEDLKKRKKIIKKVINNKKVKKQVKLKEKPKKEVNLLKKTKSVNKTNNEIVDVCTIVEKCSIDDISKYLIKQGKEKSFPNITLRE